MTKHLLILSFFIELFSIKGISCDCGYNGSFLKMSTKTPLVALVKVKKYLTFKNIYDSKTPMSMEVEIMDIYKGNESRKTVFVWGDIGNFCRPYLSQFSEGGMYVIAFDNGNYNQGHPNEKDSDYSISSCGCYWLTVDAEKKNATGDIDSKDRTTTTIVLEKLKQKFTTKDSK